MLIRIPKKLGNSTTTVINPKNKDCKQGLKTKKTVTFK